MINKEESENGIRCTNICPGEVVTEILDKRENPPSAADRERMVLPEDIAAIAIMVAAMPPPCYHPEYYGDWQNHYRSLLLMVAEF